MANTYTLLEERHIQSVESLLIADSEGANPVTVNGSTLHNRMDISGKIIGIKGLVTETSAGDGAIDARLEGSIDDTNFVIVDASAGMDLDPTGANTATGVLSAVNNSFPYWRVVLFTDGVDTVDDSSVTLTVVAEHALWKQQYEQQVTQFEKKTVVTSV